jgi:hypothetical protein
MRPHGLPTKSSMELIPTSLHSAGRYHGVIAVATIMVVVVVVLHDCSALAASSPSFGSLPAVSFFRTRDSRKAERFLLKGIGSWKVGSIEFGGSHHVPTTVRPADRKNLKPAPTIIFRCLAYWVGTLPFLPCLDFPEE